MVKITNSTPNYRNQKMFNDIMNSKSFKNSIKEKQDKIIEDALEKYKQETEHGKEISREVLSKINNATKNGKKALKSSQYWESLKNNSAKIKEKSIEQKSNLKKQSPKIYRKINSSFFYFLEVVVGRIKIGSQYGNPSLEILEKLAKLKELGILTDEEFTQKKKNILERI